MKSSVFVSCCTLMLLFSACGGEEEETKSNIVATTTTVAPTTPTAEPVILTDSFRGVTADTIKVGFTSIDFELFNEQFPGLNLTYANYPPMVDVLVEDLNARGGILGRKVEIIHRLFLPVGPLTAEVACVELTEDEEVFAVLNGFAGPGAEGVNECFTDTYETILVGAKPTIEQLERARASWITSDMNLSRRGQAFVSLLRQTDSLEGLGRIMIWGADPESEPVMDEVKELLESEGVSVPIVTSNENTGDETATIAFLEVVLEKARSEDVSTIWFVGEAIYAMEYLFGLGIEFNLLLHNGDSLNMWSQEPPPEIENSGLILTNKAFDRREDPSFAHCMDLVEEALQIEVRPPDQLGPEDTNYWPGTAGSCQFLSLFETVATAAGPDLTNETFAQAAATMGDFSLPGYKYVSLGSDKFDARDSLILGRWNKEKEQWEAISEEINTSE